MSDVIDRTPPEGGPADRAVKSRGTTIWVLIAISLAVGGAIGLLRDEWQQLPRAIQWAVYLTLAVLVIVACGLIITSPDHAPEQPRAGDDS